MKRLLFLSIWIFLIQAGVAVAADNTRTVQVGVLAYNGKAQALARWHATAEYLGKQIPEHRFLIEPLGLEEFDHAVNKRALDFFLTNSGHYVRLEVESGASRLATFRSREEQQVLTHFAAVIFSRAGQGIVTLQDLRGKTFAAVSPEAFGGFQLAQLAFREAGMEVHRNLHVRWLGFPHADIVEAVMSGRADAGIVRAGVLEALAEAGLLRLDDVQVLSPRHHEGFPFLHSTELYPEWPFGRLPHVDTDLAKQVTMALLSMPSDHPAALAALGAGWTIPLDYTPLHEVFRSLSLPPYQEVHLTLSSLFQRYGQWLWLMTGLLLVSAASLWRMFSVNRRLVQAQSALVSQQQSLEHTVQQRTDELLTLNQSLQEDIACRMETELSLQGACDTLQQLYALGVRGDLDRRQKLQSMLELCRQFLGVTYAQVNSVDNVGRLTPETFSPERTVLHALNEDWASAALASGQALQKQNQGDWLDYIACPVSLANQYLCVFEFATPVNTDGKTELAAPHEDEMQMRILHLIALWMGNEQALVKQEYDEQHLKQRFETISPRERQVLALLVKGEPSKGIARQLDISLKTVELHRANLIKKTQARTSLELVSMAARAGLG